MNKTYTYSTTDNCNHINYIYRKVRIDFYLFELVMLYKVCTNCHKLIKTHDKWKLNIK